MVQKKARKKRKKKQVLNTWRDTDRKGNVFIAEHTEEDIFVYIYLKSEDRKRYIGRINKEQRILFIRRDRSKHCHRKTSSYGFCFKLFKESTRFDTVHLRDEFGSFQFPKATVLNECRVMNFTQSEDGNDYELQYFLPIKIMNKYEKESEF
jgi:hypothetical protein